MLREIEEAEQRKKEEDRKKQEDEDRLRKRVRIV
jgi:hypothetical protein